MRIDLVTALDSQSNLNFSRNLFCGDSAKQEWLIRIKSLICNSKRSELDTTYLCTMASDRADIPFQIKLLLEEQVHLSHSQPELEVLAKGPKRKHSLQEPHCFFIPLHETPLLLRNICASYLARHQSAIGFASRWAYKSLPRPVCAMYV
jgi:hypothetical protein